MRRYNTVPWDTANCAWCTKAFPRTKQQADRRMRYCGRRCASIAKTIVLPDSHFAKMARASRASWSRRRAERLAARLAGKTLEQAYAMGVKDATDRARYRQRSTIAVLARTKAARGARAKRTVAA